uniref:Uncharacterized protein n=1 Tax=Romanomermis culicivorax TaxID=13658 RepID=A0A915L8G8_ROMCU
MKQNIKRQLQLQEHEQMARRIGEEARVTRHAIALNRDKCSIAHSSYLYTVVTSSHPSILNFDMWRWMGKFAIVFGPRTLTALKFPTNF